MRDHLLGFPAAAAHAAELEEEVAQGWALCPDFAPYPLGVPNRVRAQWEKEAADYCASEKPDPFETVVHPNPDGSETPARPVGKSSWLKGVSCKPPPVEVTHPSGLISGDEAAAQMAAYMRGYGQGRAEETHIITSTAREKAAAFSEERSKRIAQNEAARAMGEANGVGVALARLQDQAEWESQTGTKTLYRKVDGPNFQPNGDSPCALGG